MSISLNKPRPKNIYISTNVSCNLRCIYCYEDKSSNKTFDLEITKSRLNKILTKPSEQEFIINLHGGEPFLIFPQIKELCEWVWAQKYPCKVMFFATTNGTLIHGEIKDWISQNKNRFRLGLSLDGTPDMHNVNRSNSYDKIDLDFFIKTWPSQGIKMTISPKTIHNLAEGIMHIHGLGFKDIRCNFAEMVEWENDSVSILEDQLRKLSDFYLDNPDLKRSSIMHLNLIEILNTNSPIQKWCGIGEMNALDIESDNKYPCHLMFPSVCGKSKSDKSLSFDFNNIENLISEQCRECEFIRICPTCYGSNYIARGDFAQRDMKLCQFTKCRIKIIAELEYNIILNNSNNLSSIPTDKRIYQLRMISALEKLIPLLH